MPIYQNISYLIIISINKSNIKRGKSFIYKEYTKESSLKKNV